MDSTPYISIPTWSPSKNWYYTDFATREELRDFVTPLFKEPGLYNFDETVEKFSEHAKTFLKKRIYCEFQETSNAYVKFWDTEKEKCRKGVIYHNDKGDTWYLPRFFYHWINFLQIYDKRPDVKKFVFPEFRDVQYHVSLYEVLAELHDLNSAWLKRRQMASSYLHLAKIFNKYIFEEGYVGKIGASKKSFIEGVNGCWRYLNQYIDFNNAHTAWIRYNDPNTVYSWQQRTKGSKETPDGKLEKMIGTMAVISGITFEQDPVSGVGGAVDEFFYEEGGVAPTANETYAYLKDAMKEGAVKTGIFTIAGSVGDLGQCEPLKELILNPIGNDIYPVTTTLKDDKGIPTKTGLFIPVFWGMVPFIDKYGNSLVREAREYIDREYAEKKKTMRADLWQIMVSQGPRTISEAFATRTESIFPAKYTIPQAQRIEDGEYYLKHVDLFRGDDGKVSYNTSDRKPIAYDSVDKNPDKRGCGVMHEPPIPNVQWGTYYAAIDPVEKGGEAASDSYAAIYVFKNPIQVLKTSGEDRTLHTEGGLLVFEWVGRYDDIDDTNEMLSMVVELYNAWTMCENNKSTWIQHMRFRQRQKYLARKSDMIFDKEMDSRQTVQVEYGVYMTDKLWKDLLEYAISFLSDKLGTIRRQEGDDKPEKIVYGVERIPFIGLIREMQAYNDKGNFDRLKAFGILIGFIKSQEAKRGGLQQRVERTEEDDERMKKLYEDIKHRNPFNNIGNSYRPKGMGIRKSGFRHMR